MEEKRIEIYCDNAATTKVHPDVASKVQEYFLENYGNASSQHFVGKKAKKGIEDARKKIAEYIGAQPEEIIFTSGGTESDNLAIRGVARANPEKKHIITSKIEHPAILRTCEDMQRDGYQVDYLGVDGYGFVNVEELKGKIREDTLLVSIMHVNNEIGTVQSIEEIGRICKERGVYFHTDAVQSFTKVAFDITNIDMLSVSGHKIQAPKGIGFLYVKNGVNILPISTGGGHERGIRSGTENTAGIIGLAASLDINNRKDEIKMSRDYILGELKKMSAVRVNGSEEERVYHNINISFQDVEGEGLMLMLSEDGIAVSTGSACSSTKSSASHVLQAINLGEDYIHGSLRITLGEDIIGNEDYLLERIKKRVEELREINSGVKNEKN